MSDHPSGGPRYEPEAAHPEFAALKTAVTSGDWPTVEQFFAGLETADEKIWIAARLGDIPGSERFLRERALAEPPDALARLIYANRLIDLGWDIRTGARAKHVSKEQFAAFHEHLRRAEQILIELTARDPGNVPAWAFRLNTARGLQLGLAESERRYQRLARYEPHSFQAQAYLLQRLCPKWSGSFERMHAFAAECAKAAPEGALNGAIVAEGHIEHWLELKTEQEQVAYLRSDSVQQELAEAAARSVLHPAFRQRYGWVTAHSVFAMAFGLAGNHEAAARHFLALGDLASGFPWGYVGDEEYRRLRTAALIGGKA